MWNAAIFCELQVLTNNTEQEAYMAISGAQMMQISQMQIWTEIYEVCAVKRVYKRYENVVAWDPTGNSDTVQDKQDNLPLCAMCELTRFCLLEILCYSTLSSASCMIETSSICQLAVNSPDND